MTSAADSPSAVPGSPALPGSPAVAARPAVVTAAFWFQVALVAVLLILVGTSIAGAVHYNGLIDEAARATTPDPEEVAFEREGNLAGTLFTGIPLLILAVWLGLSAVWMRRGNNIARILTWIGLGAPVLLGLGACFLGFAGILAVAAFVPFDESFPDDPEFTDDPGFDGGGEFYDKLYSLDNGSVAYDVVISSALALAVLFAVTVVVLLFTGPANRFFRPLGRGGPAHFPYGSMPGPLYPPAPGTWGYPGAPAPGPYGYASPPPGAAYFGPPQAAGPYGPYGPPLAAGPFGPPPAAGPYGPPPNAGPYGYAVPPPFAGPVYPPPAAGTTGYAGPPPQHLWNQPPPFPPSVPFPGEPQPFPAAPTWDQAPASDSPPNARPDSPASPDQAPPDQASPPAQDR